MNASVLSTSSLGWAVCYLKPDLPQFEISFNFHKIIASQDLQQAAGDQQQAVGELDLVALERAYRRGVNHHVAITRYLRDPPEELTDLTNEEIQQRLEVALNIVVPLRIFSERVDMHNRRFRQRQPVRRPAENRIHISRSIEDHLLADDFDNEVYVEIFKSLERYVEQSSETSYEEPEQQESEPEENQINSKIGPQPVPENIAKQLIHHEVQEEGCAPHLQQQSEPRPLKEAKSEQKDLNNYAGEGAHPDERLPG